MPTSLVDLLVTCDRVLVGEELGGERRWRKLNIELNDLTDCSDRNKEIISLVRRTSVGSKSLVRDSYHLSNK